MHRMSEPGRLGAAIGWALLTAAILVLPAPASARTVTLESAPVVCVSSERRVEVNGSGSKAVRRERTLYAVRETGELADGLRSQGVMSSYEDHPVRVELRVWNADGERLVKTLADFTDIPFLADGSFVSDTRYFGYRLPPLEAGDSLLVTAETRIEPFLGFPLHTFGSYGVPLLEAIYEVRIPAKLDPRYRIWNGLAAPDSSADGDRTVWTWKVGPLLPPESERLAPPPADVLPTVSIGVNRTAWGPTDTWEAVGRSYWEQARGRFEAVQAASLASRRPQDELSPLEFALEQVQNNVRYVAIELGPGGRIPHESEQVLHRRYGDCKDMATLLLSMLGTRDVAGSIALVYTRPPAGLRVDPLPTFEYFNHAVACVDRDGADLWLDATDTYRTVRNPRRDIQGAPALVVTGERPGYRRVFRNPATSNRFTNSVVLTETASGKWRADVALVYSGVLAEQMSRNLDREGGPKKSVARWLETQEFHPTGEVPHEAIHVVNPAPDSLLMSFHVVVERPVTAQVGGATFFPVWEREPYPFAVFRERDRTTDVYWPILEVISDTLVVRPRTLAFTARADTAASTEVAGLGFAFLEKLTPDELRLARTATLAEPALPVDRWEEARRERELALRLGSHSYDLEVKR